MQNNDKTQAQQKTHTDTETMQSELMPYSYRSKCVNRGPRAAFSIGEQLPMVICYITAVLWRADSCS